eukprot:NODE_20904_length_777_cov_0.986154.p2 GENE.NODE_20904_length_777_cov_0.986154~~NODE_20904_length_777_cov_0.986154.p2  ORF type:complete len:175 (-),score=47.19 NODE_20904_length_777_cov_0.986154:50-574(-)
MSAIAAASATVDARTARAAAASTGSSSAVSSGYKSSVRPRQWHGNAAPATPAEVPMPSKFWSPRKMAFGCVFLPVFLAVWVDPVQVLMLNMHMKLPLGPALVGSLAALVLVAGTALLGAAFIARLPTGEVYQRLFCGLAFYTFATTCVVHAVQKLQASASGESHMTHSSLMITF